MRNRILARKSQIATVLVALLLVAATALATLALTRPTPGTNIAASDDVVRVAVIGDSYSSGLRNRIVWPTLVADSSALSISNVAIPGAGYVGGAGESGPFTTQTEKALASKPDVIVVFGGINDVGKSKELITQSATDLFGELARRAPTAKLVVLGPLWHEDTPPQPVVAIDVAVAAAAEATRVDYVRLIDEKWLVGEGLIQDDGVHPTDEGQSTMARALGALLQRQIRQQGGEG